MLKLRALAASLLAACALTGCGGGSHAKVVAGHSCSPSDYAMQCALSPTVAALPPVGVTPVAHGIDFAWSCPNPSAANWGSSNYAFGASYLSYDRSKNWTRGCVDLWHSLGAATVVVWETGSTAALNGYSAGRSDAFAARSQARALGNTTRPIFFAIDFDESPGQAGAVASYFQGVDSVLGVGRAGAYGSYWAIKRLFDARLIAYGWQTYAWSGGLWDSRAKLEQYLNASTVDYDRATAADYGQWPYSAPRPHPAPQPKPRPKPPAPKPKPPAPKPAPHPGPSYNENFAGGFQRGFTVAYDRRRHRPIPAPAFTATNSVAFQAGFQSGFLAGWKVSA